MASNVGWLFGVDVGKENIGDNGGGVQRDGAGERSQGKERNNNFHFDDMQNISCFTSINANAPQPAGGWRPSRRTRCLERGGGGVFDAADKLKRVARESAGGYQARLAQEKLPP